MKLTFVGFGISKRICKILPPLGAIFCWCNSAIAQVTPDGSLNTTVSQSGNHFTITNGSPANSNLFHSFQQFSVPIPTNKLGIIAAPGQTFALVGGDVNFDGGVITAPIGRIEVGSGTVSLTPIATGWQLGYTQAPDLGDINFTNRSSLWNPNFISNTTGIIQLRGRNITLS